MSKTKSGSMIVTLLIVLVLSVLALVVTLYKKSNGQLDQVNTPATKNLFVEPKVTPVSDSDLDKRLIDINSGVNDIDSSFKDVPISNL